MFSRRKLLRRLRQIGTQALISYRVILNDGITSDFSDMSEVKNYLSNYRKDNVIYKLEIYRIEVYSL